MTKHEAVYKYFSQVEDIASSTLGFNFSPESEGSISIVTNYSDRVRKSYVRSYEKEYGLVILVVKPYSSDSDDLNLEAMNFAQGVMDWISDQNKKRQYPDFGDKCQVKKIENLQNMPNLSGVNPEQGLARYMVQLRIVYFEKED